MSLPADTVNYQTEAHCNNIGIHNIFMYYKYIDVVNLTRKKWNKINVEIRIGRLSEIFEIERYHTMCYE